jgi:GGDEF domain-containing protein
VVVVRLIGVRSQEEEPVSDQGTHIDLLRDAVRGGRTDAVGVAHEVGASAAQTGVPLHEVLDRVERAYVPHPPDVEVVRAAAVAWGDASLMRLADVSCHDPLTSLASVPYLRSRLAEVFRGAESTGRCAADTHVLVVVELPRAARGNDLEHALRALEVAEVLRTVFTGDETVAQASVRRFAVLAARERADDLALGLVVRLLDRTLGDAVRARVWVERLPVSPDGVPQVLAGLCE